MYKRQPLTPIALDPYVFDPDDHDSTLSWVVYGDLNIEITIDENHIVHLTPLDEWAGQTELTFRVSDPLLNMTEYLVTFDTFDENDPPRFMNVTDDIRDTLLTDTTLEFSVEALDPEDDAIEYSWLYHGETVGTGVTFQHHVTVTGYDSLIAIVSDGTDYSAHKWTWVADQNAVSADPGSLPTAYTLEAVYPNPFNAQVTICLLYTSPSPRD